MVFSGGRWILQAKEEGRGTTVAPNFPGGSPVDVLEAQSLTLLVGPFTLSTADEREDIATRNNAASGRQRAAAFPEDTAVKVVDSSLQPFAEWPWGQSLPFRNSYSMSGRILRNSPTVQ
jgi:hypothetical protein